MSQEFQCLFAAANAAHDASDFRELRRIAGQLSALGAASSDRTVAAWALYFEGLAHIHHHDGRSAERALAGALDYFREAGDRLNAARALMNLASAAIDIEVNAGKARRLYEEAAPAIREDGDERRIAILCGNLGEVCRLEGDIDSALRNGREALQLFTKIDDPVRAAWQHVNIAHCESMSRNWARAIDHMRAAMELLKRDPNPLCVTWYFDVWVIMADKLGASDVAVRLLGFIDRMRSDHSLPRVQGILPWLSSAIERLSATLPEDRLQQLYAEGAALSLHEAQEQAAALASQHAPVPAQAS